MPSRVRGSTCEQAFFDAISATRVTANVVSSPRLRNLQVINIVFDAGPHTASSGLGLTSTPAPAVSSPSAPASAPAPPAPQQAPIPAQTQAQAPRPIAASSSPSKYMGFGNDKSSSAPDHKPLSSYFTNTPPPPTAHATGSSPAGWCHVSSISCFSPLTRGRDKHLVLCHVMQSMQMRVDVLPF